jgi:hypothetical protein
MPESQDERGVATATAPATTARIAQGRLDPASSSSTTAPQFPDLQPRRQSRSDPRLQPPTVSACQRPTAIPPGSSPIPTPVPMPIPDPRPARCASFPTQRASLQNIRDTPSSPVTPPQTPVARLCTCAERSRLLVRGGTLAQSPWRVGARSDPRGRDGTAPNSRCGRCGRWSGAMSLGSGSSQEGWNGRDDPSVRRWPVRGMDGASQAGQTHLAIRRRRFGAGHRVVSRRGGDGNDGA